MSINTDFDALERLAKFPAGTSADPTKNMSPEDAEKWHRMNEEYGDKLKKQGFGDGVVDSALILRTHQIVALEKLLPKVQQDPQGVWESGYGSPVADLKQWVKDTLPGLTRYLDGALARQAQKFQRSWSTAVRAIEKAEQAYERHHGAYKGNPQTAQKAKDRMTKAIKSILSEAIAFANELNLHSDSATRRAALHKLAALDLDLIEGSIPDVGIARSLEAVESVAKDAAVDRALAAQVAETILQQMGGKRRLVMMIGAKNFVALNDPPGVGFKFMSSGQPSKTGNYIKITLNGLDYYDIEFGYIRGMNFRVVKEYNNVDVSRLQSLFRDQTGLALRLASAAQEEYFARMAGAGDEKESRFEEGEDADPTENMSEEDAKKWRLENLQNKDKFKKADFEPGSHIPDGWEPGVVKPGSPVQEDADLSASEIPDGEGNREKRAARLLMGPKDTFRHRWPFTYAHGKAEEILGQDVVSFDKPPQVGTLFGGLWANGTFWPAVVYRWESDGMPAGLVVLSDDRKARAEAERAMASGNTRMASLGKDAREYAGQYGFPKKVQADCETCVRKVQKEASSIAKRAYGKNAKVAEFLATHARRTDSLPAQILVAALSEMGPKVAEDMSKQARLAELREQRGVEAAGLRGKPAQLLWEKVSQMKPGQQSMLTELTYGTGHMGIHFARWMSAAEQMAKKGLIEWDGAQLTKLAKTARLPRESVVINTLGEDPDTGTPIHFVFIPPGTNFNIGGRTGPGYAIEVGGLYKMLVPATEMNISDRAKAYQKAERLLKKMLKGASLEDACWEGYEAIGMKEQGGQTVPNCVPKTAAEKKAEADAFEAFEALARALKYNSLPSSQGLRRNVSPTEFMLMDAHGGYWRFKHEPTRNYLFIRQRDGAMHVPTSDKPFFRGQFDKRASDKTARSYGLYGFTEKVASMGLQACADVRAAGGRIAYDLHSRRSKKSSQIKSYLDKHCNTAACKYSRLLAASYPDLEDGESKTAVDNRTQVQNLENAVKAVEKQVAQAKRVVHDLSDIASPLGPKAVAIYTKKEQARVKDREDLLKELRQELADARKAGKKAASKVEKGSTFTDQYGEWKVDGPAKGVEGAWNVYRPDRGRAHSKVMQEAAILSKMKKAASAPRTVKAWLEWDVAEALGSQTNDI